MKLHLIKFKGIEWFVCFLLVIFIASCSLVNDSSMKSFTIKTDQEVYLVEDNSDKVEVTYAYINKSSKNFYPGSCLGATASILEKHVNGEWMTAYAPFCARPLGAPIKINPREVYNASIQLSPWLWDPESNNETWLGGDIEGTYRVREKVYDDWNLQKFDNGTLQSEIIVSNVFEIRKVQ
ncbi:MAG: hypothetical protein JJU13_05035 [Balneolaceae bacterium]|nr:hypothetical protein [Balneolaceae bacterium]